MAIVFLKDLDSNKLYPAYNNAIVSFYSSDLSQAVKATIAIGTNVVTLYPSPDGLFSYNFKDIISTLLNNDNFKDDLEPDLDIFSNYTYDWTSKVNLSDVITFEVYKQDDTSISTTRTIEWLSGYVQLRNWKRNYPAENLLVDNIAILQRKSVDSYFDYRVKYWEGYPFDITLWVKETDTLNVTNNNNLIGYDFDNIYKVTRLVFSDGRTDISLNDELSFQDGLNDLVFDAKFNLAVEKINSCGAGVYIKWINSFGGWSYWYFNKGNEDVKIKDKGNLQNDYYNLEDTISPLVSLGKESGNTITVQERNVSEDFKNQLVDLIDSAKVYLFTGVPYSKNTFNDWMEVSLSDGTFRISNSRSNLYTFNFKFELPPNVTRTL